ELTWVKPLAKVCTARLPASAQIVVHASPMIYLIAGALGLPQRHVDGNGPIPSFFRVHLTAQVVTVQLDQIEGVQEHAGVMPPVAEAVETRHAVAVAGHSLTIDDAGA